MQIFGGLNVDRQRKDQAISAAGVGGRNMSGPLTGFRVLDLAAVVSGPLTAALLADQGAEVIKVERLTGDIQRHVGSQRNGFSGFFHVLNRGKRSIALDLGREEGIDIVHRLARDADVVIQNFRPGVVNRLGIGYDHLSAENPGLVYLSISGFGQSGPRAGQRAYDPIIQSFSGIAQVQGRIHIEHPEVPEQVNMLLLDKLTAYTGSQAITAALLARSKSGTGQHIELSMLDTAIAFSWADVAADLILQTEEGSIIDERPPIGASGHLTEYADGWGATMTLSDAEFQGLCAAYELPQLAEDSRFNTINGRMKHRNEYRELLQSTVAAAAKKLTLAEAEARLNKHEVPFARAGALTELAADPQVMNNKVFRDLHHPIAGPLREARTAPRFIGTPLATPTPAPDIGEHTTEILTELGLQERINDLVDAGVIAAP